MVFYAAIFPSQVALDQFTLSLEALLSPDNACNHCLKQDQWVSHGYVYKKSPAGASLVVGKRIVCADRYGKSGCGRTRQLYLSEIIPRRQYRLPIVILFIQQLIGGATVEQAYINAVGGNPIEPRHGWSWLKDFTKQLSQWRSMIGKPVETFVPSQSSGCLRRLLPTLEYLFGGRLMSDIGSFQWQFQRAFF